jgi:hypothetical protein
MRGESATVAAVSAIAHREYGQLGHRAASRPTAEAQAAVRAGSGSARASEPLRLYGVREMQGDKFAGGFHADEWPRNGIIFKPFAKTTSENYLHALPMLVVGTCSTMQGFVACGPRAPCPGGGRETVTHAHVASAHDDLAASSCGALVAAGDRLAYITDLSRWGGLRVTGNYGCRLQTRQTSEK